MYKRPAGQSFAVDFIILLQYHEAKQERRGE